MAIARRQTGVDMKNPKLVVRAKYSILTRHIYPFYNRKIMEVKLQVLSGSCINKKNGTCDVSPAKLMKLLSMLLHGNSAEISTIANYNLTPRAFLRENIQRISQNIFENLRYVHKNICSIKVTVMLYVC